MAGLPDLSAKHGVSTLGDLNEQNKKVNTENGAKRPFLKPRGIVRSAASALLQGVCSMGIQRRVSRLASAALGSIAKSGVITTALIFSEGRFGIGEGAGEDG